MAYTTNLQAVEKIAQLRPFEGNSMSAKYEGNEYRIYSYSTLMAVIENREITYLDNEYHSRTTSKQQTLIARGLAAGAYPEAVHAIVKER